MFAAQIRAFPLKISIVSINYAPEPTGISVYSTGLAEFLAAAGHSVTVYTAFSYYPAWKKSDADIGRLFASDLINGVAVKRSYIYVPAQPTALRRILHEFSFASSAALRFLFGSRPDVTIVVSPPLLLGVLFGLVTKLKRSPMVLHVQDLQPDAAIDLGMLKPGKLTQVLFAIERWGYSLATRVSTISGAMRRKIESKGVPEEKCLIFKNWANDELIQPLEPADSLRAEWSLDGRFVVLYSGNMGVKQGLGMMLDAAEALRLDPDILFLIVGDGGEKERLVSTAQARGLSNVRFMPPVAKEELSRLLASADVAVITQKSGIDDLVLPSKLGNLLSSQRAVIASTTSQSELATILKQSDCGVVIPPEDGGELASSVQQLKDDSSVRQRLASNGRKYAVSNLGSQAILKKFAADLVDIVALK